MTKEDYKKLMMKRHNITEQDMDMLWKAFMMFGNNCDKTHSNSNAAHYYFQGICEHLSIDWDSYGKRMPNDAIGWMQVNVPQLIGVNDINYMY